MSKKLIVKIAVAGLLTLTIGIASYYSLEWMLEKAFIDGMCGNGIVAEVKSPNGKLKAVVFERNCGATTGVSTQISILPESEELANEVGNVCVVDVFPKVELRWAGNNELVIAHHGGARLFHAVQSFDGINIRYEVPTQAASNSLNPTPR
jgi:hypothetical protein